MIIKEFYRTREDGVNLYRTFSDQNLIIRKIGTQEEYIDAIDIENTKYSYEETEIPIPTPEEPSGAPSVVSQAEEEINDN